MQEEQETMGRRLDSEGSKVFTMNDVSMHCDADSCWIVIKDNVYDVTGFLKKHPGGLDVILENAGRDATVPFADKGHSETAVAYLDKYWIGELTERQKIGDITTN